MKIAVLDSGVAYDRSPDLSSDPLRARPRLLLAQPAPASSPASARTRTPDDEYGHGTHVASTIAETTNNGKGLTGLAYGATVIPVKVLNRYGDGDEYSIANGLRYAADQRRAGDQPELRVRLLDHVRRRRSRGSPPRSGTRGARAR